MIPTWLESILPGLRESRPSLVAGVMWTLVLGLVFHEDLASLESGPGPIPDVFTAIARAHPLVQALIAGTLVFGVGAIASAPVEFLAHRIGTISGLIRARREWQQRASARRSQVEATIQRTTDQMLTSTAPPSTLDASLAKENEKLEALRIGWWPLRRIKRTPVNIELVGPSNPVVEPEIIFGAAARAAEAKFANSRPDVFDGNFLRSLRDDYVLADLASKLTTELQYSGDELLRRHAREAAMDIDRERSEARVRIAVGVPFIAVGGVLGGPYGAAIGGLALLTLIHSSIKLADAGERALQVLAVSADLRTPSITEAEWVGRERAQEEMDERERQDRLQAETNRRRAAQKRAVSGPSTAVPPEK